MPETKSVKSVMVFYYKREVEGFVLFFRTTVTKSHINYLNWSIYKDIHFKSDDWILSTQNFFVEASKIKSKWKKKSKSM